MREVRRTPSVVCKEFEVSRIDRKRAEAARFGEARDMRVHVIQGGVRRDVNGHACGRQHPMVAGFGMALIALAGRR